MCVTVGSGDSSPLLHGESRQTPESSKQQYQPSTNSDPACPGGLSSLRQQSHSGDSDEDSSNAMSRQKTVAINTSQNKLFTHRLLPVHSPDFDNVMDQVLT